MNLIADRNGVEVVISPVVGNDGFSVVLDFNHGKIKLDEIENRARKWDLRLYDGRKLIGRVKFTAFQFLADGIERRTISLNYIEIEPAYQGQGRTYDVGNFVIQTVTETCNREWGAIESKPVLFIEKKDLVSVPRDKQSSIFAFLKKLGEKILGVDPKPQPVPDHDLVATAIGDDISIQLIEGHLVRSDKLDIK